jgi:hypothetical protein
MALCLVAGPVIADEAAMTMGATDVMFAADEDGWRLTVSGPDGVYFQKSFKPGVAPAFSAADLEGKVLPDGLYNYELRQQPRLPQDVRSAMFAARAAGDDAALAKLQAEGKIPYMVTIKSGAFTVAKGGILNRYANELTKDHLIYDDLIVTGSICVGFDCANGESFGYDTLKLKENNLRLFFEDTSAGSFPTGDWRIRINDTTSGGASYFAVEDATNARTPFRIETGAPNHSLYVEDYGRVGLGTSIPYVELHIVDGDSPTIRLDQDGSSGWTAQRWDMCGNETNFFVRDVTNGSKLSFRIQPNTPSSTLSLRSSGFVGIGTWSPEAKLHVDALTGAAAEMLRLKNNGGTYIALQNTSTNETWYFNHEHDSPNRFIISSSATSGPQLELSNTGDLTIQGDLVTGGGGTCDPGPCDAVFTDYELESIEEHAAYMWENSHLWGVGPTPEDAPVNLSQKTTGILHELEKAHIYIEQLNSTIKELEARLEKLEKAEE